MAVVALAQATVDSRVTRRDGEALRDWFVDPQRAPEGAVLYRVSVGLSPSGS